MDQHPYNRKTTETEVPLGAIQFEGCAQLRKRIVRTVRRTSPAAMIEPRSPRFSPEVVAASWRFAHECHEMITAAQRVESDVWHASLYRQAVNASRRRFLNLRGAVRRIGGRSHRRAGRRVARTARGASAEGPEPDPAARLGFLPDNLSPVAAAVVVVYLAASLVGFAVGSALALVLP